MKKNENQVGQPAREPVCKVVETVGELIEVLKKVDPNQPLTLTACWEHRNNWCFAKQDWYDVRTKQKDGKPIGQRITIQELDDGRVELQNTDSDTMCVDE